MKALVAALAAEQAPCPRGRSRRRSRAGRRSDGAGGGEGESRGLGQPVLGALQFPGAASAIRGLPACLARRSSRTRLRDHDLVVVIGAPVFTFHVEGHASIFDGATTIFQITDDPTAAAVTPSRHQHHRHHEAGADDAAGTAAGDQARDAGGPHAAARASGRRSDSGRIPAAYAVIA